MRKTQTTTDCVIRDARRVMGGQMESSARLCLSDAIEAANNGDYPGARARALRSIAYSVGILSSVYRRHTEGGL